MLLLLLLASEAIVNFNNLLLIGIIGTVVFGPDTGVSGMVVLVVDVDFDFFFLQKAKENGDDDDDDDDD
jgi:hypothetical protein